MFMSVVTRKDLFTDKYDDQRSNQQYVYIILHYKYPFPELPLSTPRQHLGSGNKYEEAGVNAWKSEDLRQQLLPRVEGQYSTTDS